MDISGRCESDASSRSDRFFCSSTASLVSLLRLLLSVLRILVQGKAQDSSPRCAGSTLFKCSFLSAAYLKVRLVFILQINSFVT